MGKYEVLTKHIPKLMEGDFGGWAEQTGDGSKLNPYTWPYVIYSKSVNELNRDIFSSEEDYEEYNVILEENNVEKSFDTDVSNLNGASVVALLIAIFRTERFCEGTILEGLKNGMILRCLNRLKEIDESNE